MIRSLTEEKLHPEQVCFTFRMIPDVCFNTHTHQVEALLRSLVLYLLLCICDLFSLCLHFPFIMFHTCLTPSALLISHSLSLSLSLSLSHTHTHFRSVWLSKPMWAGGLI